MTTAQRESPNRQLGPILGATLLCKNIDDVIQAYLSLSFSVFWQGHVEKSQAQLWHAKKLDQAKMAILASSDGTPWLRVIEQTDLKAAMPLKSYGWMSLETNVADVDSLSKKISAPAFKVIGEPAYLQVSDAIKAMQVIGPANEVSYLTQVERDVPPFELPQTTFDTAGLFIPVLATPNRTESLAFYEALHSADKGLCFDTKITVLNQAWQKPIDSQYPVATLQLAGKCLFEIDQIDGAAPIVENQESLPSGIAMISCQVENVSHIAQALSIHESTVMTTEHPYYTHQLGANKAKVLFVQGPAGEYIEFIEAL